MIEFRVNLVNTTKTHIRKRIYLKMKTETNEINRRKHLKNDG